MFAGRNWRPKTIDRVSRVLNTSTKPIHVVTDQGPAIVKYMGNPAGLDALVCEVLGSELANELGLKTPDFAIANIPMVTLPDDATVQVVPGPAFFSRWEESASLAPKSSLLKELRHPEDLAKLVVLDTWLRNKDRFSRNGAGGHEVVNYDNVLLRRDIRKVELLVIDHSHALVETTLEDELDQAWVDEQEVYGRFDQFEPFLTQKTIRNALKAVNRIDLEAIQRICHGVPPEWGMTMGLENRLSSCIFERGKELATWLPAALFDQYEMKLDQGEGM